MSVRYRTEARRPHFIRCWRRARGLSVAELAGRIGVSKATLSRIERGEQPYTQDTLEALANALDREPTDLICHNPVEDRAIEKLKELERTIWKLRDMVVLITMVGAGFGGEQGGAVASAGSAAKSLADDALDAIRAMGAF